MGNESEEEKDHWYRQNEIHERCSSKVQERLPDWCTQGREGDNCGSNELRKSAEDGRGYVGDGRGKVRQRLGF